jgi:hypothetical protein
MQKKTDKIAAKKTHKKYKPTAETVQKQHKNR